MNRTQRTELAQATLKIIESGTYELPDGSQIDIDDAVSRAISDTIHYAPEDFVDVRAQCEKILAQRDYATRFQVVNSTTFAAARELTLQAVLEGRTVEASETTPYAEAMSLNFASAKNPGGGLLKGSQAQEECLARALC